MMSRGITQPVSTSTRATATWDSCHAQLHKPSAARPHLRSPFRPGCTGPRTRRPPQDTKSLRARPPLRTSPCNLDRSAQHRPLPAPRPASRPLLSRPPASRWIWPGLRLRKAVAQAPAGMAATPAAAPALQLPPSMAASARCVVLLFLCLPNKICFHGRISMRLLLGPLLGASLHARVVGVNTC